MDSIQFTPTTATQDPSTAQNATPTATQQQQDMFLSALTAAMNRPGTLADAGGDSDDEDDGSSLTVKLGG